MKIGGPFLDPARQPPAKRWYLSYFVPKKNPDGTLVLREGRAVLERKRPYFDSREEAQEEKPAIAARYAAAGVSPGGGVLTREQTADYEAARQIAPEVSAAELARFWRLHHPLHATRKIRELVPDFLASIEARLGKTAGVDDLKSRVGIFALSFGDRLPETISRSEILRWLESKPRGPRHRGGPPQGRTILNLKQAVCRFFNWMLAQDPPLVAQNPASHISRAQLPKIRVNEIEFLSLESSARYLRALERYDPELVAHEIVQLLAGVRADDEMANFSGDWVFPETREVVIPAAIAKTERREVISTLEPLFWEWWRAYGRRGVLRPKNYPNRWRRIRILASIREERRADEVAALGWAALWRVPEAASLPAWPWNARRRTFTTYHVAKHQNAHGTALILRHRGEAETLHNSYRGQGVTPAQGALYFSQAPRKVRDPITPPQAARPARGIVRHLMERERAPAA